MTSRLSRMRPQPRDVAESSSDDDESSGERDAPTEFLKSTLSRFSRVGLQPRDVVEISSDDGGSPVPAPRTRSKKGKDDSDDDDDCVVLDGDPDKLLAVVGAKVRTSGDDASDEVEIVAAKGQVSIDLFLMYSINRQLHNSLHSQGNRQASLTTAISQFGSMNRQHVRCIVTGPMTYIQFSFATSKATFSRNSVS